jgi:hypothetical protein
MHTIQFPDTNLKVFLPSNLGECDKQQYIEMCDLIFRMQNEMITFEELKINAVYKLLNLKRKVSNWPEDEKFKLSNIAILSDYVEDFFDVSDDGQKTIIMGYIHNPIPKMSVLFKKYYGPADSFLNMTFGEYTDALRMFHDFYATGDTKLLYLMTAILYRKQKPLHFIRKRLSRYDGDIRIRYNSNLIEERAEGFKYAPFGFIYGVFLLFASFQKHLVEAKIMWSGQELDLSILFDSQDPSPDNSIPGIGMDSIAFAMAESGAFGSLEKVRETNFWQIIVRMYDLRKTDIERKRQENATNK